MVVVERKHLRRARLKCLREMVVEELKEWRSNNGRDISLGELFEQTQGIWDLQMPRVRGEENIGVEEPSTKEVSAAVNTLVEKGYLKIVVIATMEGGVDLALKLTRRPSPSSR